MDVVQGYGLTETCGGGTLQPAGDAQVGVIGRASACNEVRLASDPETGYLVQDRVGRGGLPVLGRGEVLIRGDNVAAGYFKRDGFPLDADGWFHTGDIAQLEPDGRTYRIVDRKKNLVKTRRGEYVALEHLESVYAGAECVDAARGGVCVYASALMDRPCALVVSTASDAEALQQLNARLNQLGAVRVVPGPWTAENGLLTATHKLNRRAVYARHRDLLDDMERG